MVKLIFFCRRRAEVTHERYIERLLGGHVPLAIKHHPTLRRYVVNIVEHTPPGMAQFDSIGELSFETLADFRERLYDSPAGKRIIEDDVRGFMGAAHAYATTEHIQKATASDAAPGTRSPGIKLVCPVQRRPDLTHVRFVEHWLTRHVPLALVHHPALCKYVTNVVDERLSPDAEDFDGIAELHFASQDDLQREMFDSPEGERVIRDDIARFIGRTGAYRVAEYVQKPQ